MNDGDTHNSPIEQAEAKYPVLVEHYRLAQDSGGAGRHRGGLGIDRVVRARTAMTVNTQVDRAHCLPWGLEGGREGAGNAVSVRLGGKWKEDFPNAKVLVARLDEGDAYRMRSGGGGGYGDPRERPAAAVAEDVRQGYVSVKAAKELYGVVVDAVTGVVDEKGTRRLRGKPQGRAKLKRRKATKNRPPSRR
jgi:N-methylhydantoinase B